MELVMGVLMGVVERESIEGRDDGVGEVGVEVNWFMGAVVAIAEG
jgi:hypothetical protein